MTTQHGAQAVEHLEQARSAIDGLAELRKIPEHSPKAVAAFYDEINQNMKLADVEAQLYIGDRLTRIIETLRGLSAVDLEELHGCPHVHCSMIRAGRLRVG